MPEGGTKESSQSQRNPKLGAIYMLIFVVLQSVNWFSTKLLYIYYPSIHFLQILMFRNVISSLVIFAYENRNVKYAMYDSVPSDQYVNIFLRVLQGTSIKCINFYSFKHWKITTIAMIISLAPVSTMILGVILLGESVNKSDICQITLSFIAVTCITLNSLMDKEALDNEKNQKIKDDPWYSAKFDHITVFRFVLLILWPIGSSLQNILLRKMKKMNSTTLSCWVNPSMFLFAYIALIYEGIDSHNFIVDIL